MRTTLLRFALLIATIFVIVLATPLASTLSIPLTGPNHGVDYTGSRATDGSTQPGSSTGVVSRSTGGVTTSLASFAGQVLANITVGSAPQRVLYDSGNGYVYVANSQSDNVSVLSGTALLGNITVGAWPLGMVYDSGNGYVYVANDGGNTVSVIWGMTVVGNITVGTKPFASVYDNENGYVYVSNAGSVSVISGTSVVATVPLSSNQPVGGAIAYDSGNGYVYVAMPLLYTGPGYPTSMNVSVISGTSLVGTVLVGTNPEDLVYDSGNGYVYVANYDTSNVSVLSGLTVVSTISVPPGPFRLVYDEGNGQVYVLCTMSDVLALLSDTTVVGTVPLPQYSSSTALVYDRGNGYVYVASIGWNNVSVISGSTRVGTVPAGTAPVALAYNGGNGYVYVANRASDTVSVISPLWINSFTASPPQVPMGGTTTFDVVAYGGTGGLTYSFSGLPPGCTSLDSPMLGCTPTAAGNYTIRVEAEDSLGHSASANITFIVRPWPMPQPLYSVSFTQTGLPNGTVWSVTLDGYTQFTATNSIVFAKPNGSYSFGVSSVAGYAIAQQLGKANVSGAPLLIPVAFAPLPGPLLDLGKFIQGPAGLPAWTLPALIVASIGSALIAVDRRTKMLRREGEQMIQALRSLDDDASSAPNEEAR